ncbi:MAG: IS110 family transposase [bacterium]
MYYTGCDAHSKITQLQHMDEDGALGLSMVVATTPEGLSDFLARLDAPTEITFEASRGYWWLHEFFKSHPKVSKVHVVDPRRSRVLAQELSVLSGYGRAKNDRIDTEMLAEQTRRGLAPTIQIPTAEQFELRTLNRHRLIIVEQRTSAASRIHGILSMHGVSISLSELINNSESRNKLYNSLPEYVQFVTNNLIEQIHLFEGQIQYCENELEKLLPESHPDINILMTAPGFGPVFSRTVKTEILDIHYFKAPKYLISYSGLAPVDHESAGKKGPISLNRHCNYYLKYAFVGAAHNARTHVRYRQKYELDVKKHGKIQAKLNLARRLAKTVYWMLIRQQPYKF